MRKIKILIYLFIIIFLGCEEDDLTEIKYNGTGGMSCLVNGKVINNIPEGTYCEFKFLKNGILTLQLGFTDDKNYTDYTFEFISLRAYNIDYDQLEGATFELADKNSIESYGVYEINSTVFRTNSTNNGELKILYYDNNKNIIGGTFWFDAENHGDHVRIRDGRFDLPIKNPK